MPGQPPPHSSTPVKLTPTAPPLTKHAALCQQVLVSCKQREQKCEGFLRHGRGLLIPSHCLFLPFFLLPSYVLLKKKSQEKELQFFLSLSPPSSLCTRSQVPLPLLSLSLRPAFMPLCTYTGTMRVPMQAGPGWAPGSPSKALRGVGKGEGRRGVRDWLKREGGLWKWYKRRGASERVY